MNQSPLEEKAVVRRIYGFLEAIEMFKVSRVSKTWDVASRLPEFHTDKLELTRLCIVFPTYFTTVTINVSSIPASRFPDVATLVHEFDVTMNQKRLPDYFFEAAHYPNLKKILIYDDIEESTKSFIQAISPPFMELPMFQESFQAIVSELSCTSVKLLAVRGVYGGVEAFEFLEPAELFNAIFAFPNLKAMWFLEREFSPPPTVEIVGHDFLTHMSKLECIQCPHVKILVLNVVNGFRFERSLGPEMFGTMPNLERVIFLEGREWPGPEIPGITFESNPAIEDWEKIDLMLRLIEETTNCSNHSAMRTIYHDFPMKFETYFF